MTLWDRTDIGNYDENGDGRISDEEMRRYEASQENAPLRDARRDRNDRIQNEYDIPDWMDQVAGIPLIGDGVRADLARRRAEFEAELQRRPWDRLAMGAPTREELTARYEDEVWADGGPSAWAVESEAGAEGRRGMEDALAAMREWSRGGFTEADRAMMDEAERREGMNARADREAAMSALEARGMGGSGATTAAMLSAGEAASARGAGMYSDMLSAAQARQMDATRAMADIGSRARSHDETRTAGMEGWLNREADYTRDLGERNTNRHNAERDNEASAAQTWYENRERATAGLTGNYSTDVARRSEENRRADEASRNQANTIGTILSEIV